MAFDPTRPVNGPNLPVDANFLRGQFNDLDARVVSAHQRINQAEAGVASAHQRIDQHDTNNITTNARIDQTNADVSATNARIDNLPPAFPHNGDAEINGNLKTSGMNYAGGVGIGVSDAGGSGETGILIGADSNTGILLPLIAIRGGGSTVTQLRWDIGGQIDGSGTPTLQDGALYRVDLMSGALKPWNVTVETIYYTDHNGNPQTKQVLVPPP